VSLGSTRKNTPTENPIFIHRCEAGSDDHGKKQWSCFQANEYREIEKNEVRYEEIQCEDAEYLFVAFGSAARICLKSIEMAREEGIKVGLLRPITFMCLSQAKSSERICRESKGNARR